MTDAILPIVLAVLAIALATVLGPRLRIAGPLLLVMVGVAVSFMPFVPPIEVEPELILVVVLPPLLYSAAVSLPAIEFRRDFRPIAGLAVILVVVSTILLGLFFIAVIPDIQPMIAFALGAILSPTDAVATSIVKRLGISGRVVTLLEGESLLNDATSLVILRTTVAAAVTGTFSAGGVVWSFVWGVAVAVVVGAIVGILHLQLRKRITHAGASTAIGFLVPFVAYLPTEHLGGSGLVAAVMAGIVTGQGKAQFFTPEQRFSDMQVWRTVELVLEGGVFLIMGLELRELIDQASEDNDSVWNAAWIAAVALVIILLARAAFVSIIVWRQTSRSGGPSREQLERIGERLDQVAENPEEVDQRRLERSVRDAVSGNISRGGHDHHHEGIPGSLRGSLHPGSARRTSKRMAQRRRKALADRDPNVRERRLARMRTGVTRMMADLDYYEASPLGWKHGTVIVWAGMRGVVTLAAAQTLPADTDSRALLVLIAFLVAAGSLIVQGSTLELVVRWIRLEEHPEVAGKAEQKRLKSLLKQAAVGAYSDPALVREDGTPFPQDLLDRFIAQLSTPLDESWQAINADAQQLAAIKIKAMRAKLIEVSSGGEFSTPVLRQALVSLDADQLRMQIHRGDTV